MQYRTLGKTGISVSRLCFGALTVGPCQADLSPDLGGAVIAHAIERGVNFIDTAQLYQSYEAIKNALDRTKRSDTVIASKTYAYTAELAEEAVEEARKKLDRDVIDIFLLHEQESEHTVAGHMPALERLYKYKAEGIIRAVGLSTHRISGVKASVLHSLDVVFPLLNVDGVGIGDGTADQMAAAAREAADAGLGVYIMKPFGGGNLLSKTEECLRYALSQDYAASIAVGMQSIDEVEADLSFFEKGYFPPEIKSRLASLPRRLIIEDHCIGCGSCERVCGQDAMHIEGGRAHCDTKRCITCGYCGAACPETCIKII